MKNKRTSFDKPKLVPFKAEAADILRWKLALKTEGITLSAFCRDQLNRLAKRVEAKQGRDNGK